MRWTCVVVAVSILLVVCLPISALIPPLWDESIDGDLSDSSSSPTDIGQLDDRPTHLVGSADSGDDDYFQFTVPSGGEVTGFTADVSNAMENSGSLSCTRVSDSTVVFNDSLGNGTQSYTFTEAVGAGDCRCHAWQDYASIFDYSITFTGTGVPVELHSFSAE